MYRNGFSDTTLFLIVRKRELLKQNFRNILIPK